MARTLFLLRYILVTRVADGTHQASLQPPLTVKYFPQVGAKNRVPALKKKIGTK